MYKYLNTRLCLIIALTILLGIFATPQFSHIAYSQEPPTQPSIDQSYEVLLKSRQFIPQAGTEPTLAQGEIGVTGLESGRMHVLLQLHSSPTAEEREALSASGVELLNYIPHNAWFASIPAGANQISALGSSQVVNKVRWMGVIQPVDKVSSEVWAGQLGSWAIAEDGRVRLAASFFEDVSLDTARRVVSRYGGEVEGEIPLSNKLLLLLHPTEISALATEDTLRWLDQIPPPPTVDNDGARNATNVDIVQSAPYNLSGAGVDLGIWDEGLVDRNHQDFWNGAFRVTTVDSANVNDHATHVAGTMAGNGNESEGAGGNPQQWRGVAPEADIISYDFDDPINEYDSAVNTYDIDLSQNSWSLTVEGGFLGNCSQYGNYNHDAPDFDRIVFGQLGNRIPIIFAAGNERNDGDCGMTGGWPDFFNYSNVPPPATAKNVVTVGAVNSNDNSMTTFSSWGPVDDGRLKPEVMAPGCERDLIRNDNVFDRTIWSTLPGNAYGGECGTSMAAPVVSGIGALLIEQYRDTYNGANPWPSTIKALLVHSARDLDDNTDWFNPGPDYASGYGLVDAKGAVDLVRRLDVRQSDGIWTGAIDDHYIWVPAGTNNLKVTLAWDDHEGAENANPALVNNLNLYLMDPDGNPHHAWVLDPTNPISDATTGTGWNTRDNLEQVLVTGDNIVPGEWRIRVWAENIPEGPQDYSLVSEAFFDILAPNTINAAYAGPHDNPKKIVVKIAKPANGLTKDDFTVTIGSQTATILTVYESSEKYVLEITPPPQTANGLYDLTVSVGSSSVSETATNAVQYSDESNVDVALVIDRSGSMDAYGYMEPAKDAAKQFVDFMHDNDKIGVVSFSDWATVNYGLTSVTSSTKDAAKNAIDAITAYNMTSIGDGLLKGQNELTSKGEATHPWAIVLLSDGQENTAPFVDDILPGIKSTKTIVHTVALGSASDETLMMDIAAQTGGTYNLAPTADQLAAIYNTIAGAVSGEQTLFSVTGVVQQGSTVEKDVVVDSTVSEATFSVSWSSSTNNLDLTLRKPNGSLITPAVAAPDPNIEYVSGSTYEYYRIKSPTLVAGVWTMRISGVSISTSGEGIITAAGGETYVARVTGQTGLTLHSYFDKSSYLASEPIKVSATLADYQPILGATIMVNVTPPSQAAALIRASEWIEVNGDTIPDPAKVAEIESAALTVASTLALYDDGAHGDGQANDGVYANTLSGGSTGGAGTYTFDVSASGIANNGQAFARQSQSIVYVTANPSSVFLPLIMKNSDGSQPPPPPNNPPYTPSNPSPADNATNQSVNVDLSWTGGDPDGDAVTYDVYFEANDSSPDVLVSSNQTGTSYDPGPLNANTIYYWQIVARDSHGATTSGPVWNFTTATASTPGWYEVGSGSATGGGISNDGGTSRRVAIAVASDNRPYVAWEDDSSGNGEIYVRRWNGSSWQEVGSGSASGGGVSNNSGSSERPAVAIAPDGTPYVAWYDFTSGDAEIYVRRWTGGSWQEVGSGSASGGGISNNSGDSFAPWIAFASDSTPYIAWHDRSAGDREIYIRRWNGSSWQEVGSGSASGGGISNNSGESRDPRIIFAPDGTLYVAWADNADGDLEIYVRRWNGSSWQEVGSGSASGGGISNNSGNSSSPSMAVGSDGTVYVTWDDSSSGDYEIYVRRWNGSSWLEVGSGSASGGGISNNSGDSRYPSVAVGSGSTPYIAWHDDSGGDAEIYVRRWIGSSWQEVGSGSASGGGISNNSGRSEDPEIFIAPNGTPYVIWEDESAGNLEIYVRHWVE